jgi:hypothetical protein
MKTRLGYVSNSSSSSFIISKKHIDQNLIDMLKNICEGTIGPYDDIWDIHENEYSISGFTAIDNGAEEDGLYAWMKNNNFPMDKVDWTWD